MNLKTIAEQLTTELTGELTYQVTDDIQLFSEDMRLGGEQYVPTVLKLITSFVSDNKFIETYVLQLKFKVKKDDRDDFINDMATFRAAQADEVIGSYYVTKKYQQPIYESDETDNGVDYMYFNMEFGWVYALSIVGSQSTILVDTVAIPFESCEVVHDKSYISNEDSGSNYRMTNDTITLTVPLIVSNTKISALYDYVNSVSYNTVFALSINGVSKNVVMKQAQYTLQQNGLITGMILSLETSYPRISITLDAEVIPLANYRYNGKKEMLPSKRGGGDNMLAYANNKVRSWTITFVKDNSTIWDKVSADAYDTNLDISYSLIRDSVTYTLIMSDVVEEYTETGDMTLVCQFQEYAD